MLLLVAGFFPLIYGAGLLVDSASALAKRRNIPNIVIGLTIVSFGTSAPELVVNVFAAVRQSSDLALGNVLGSNIFNVAVILGISAIIYPLTVKSSTTWIEVPLAWLAAFLVFILAGDQLIDRAGFARVGRIDGIVLWIFFVIFLVYNMQMMRKGEFSEDIPIKEMKMVKALLLIAAGIALLVTGGRLIVFSAVKLASSWGLPERLVGLTVVSIGTSLPELATSVVAALKKNTDIAVGNVVGSNIFNVFFILGTSAVICPVPVPEGAWLDIWMNIAISLMLFLFIFTGKGRRLERWEGIIFVSLYLVYMAWIIS